MILLTFGIINAGHFDKLSDRIASALATRKIPNSSFLIPNYSQLSTFDFRP